ncbi:hypothetical protein [Streptomyces sp. NPDC056600]|uniref:hypothetical protein n=1 Tax=Streptomyces sp. NPDC056600 TaxID=3345874 RepID=UPI0036C8F48D
MPALGASGRAPKHASELHDVHELLDEMRLRPGTWVRGGSLPHLESVLMGYRIALTRTGSTKTGPSGAPGNPGPFTDWLWERLGQHSSLGWAAEIERAAEAADQSALEPFFSLFDEYRAEQSRTAR